ncbi:MAG: response regulator [Pseudomonadota bacterium]
MPDNKLYVPTKTNQTPSDVFSYISIIVMLTLIAIIVVVDVLYMRHIQRTGELIVQNRLEKITLVESMKSVARERTIILQRMMMIDDPFENDQLNLRFAYNGAKFSELRSLLLNKDLSDEEKYLLAQQGNVSTIAVPLQNDIVDLISAGRHAQAIRAQLESAVPLQDEVLKYLSALLLYQTNLAKASIAQTRLVYKQGLTAMIVMTIVAFFVTFILAYFLRKITRERSDYLTQLAAANRAKSSFLAKMSHEIRTPLTAIIGFAEASLDSGQTMDERIKALKIIKKSGLHLLQIINDILDISKIEAEKLAIKKIECSLFEILTDIEALARIQSEHKGLSFNINYQYPLPKLIMTDPLRAKQIIINLTNNAIKFTSKGHVTINVAYTQNNNKLTIEVEDTGIGLSAEEATHLFKDFEQADAEINRKFGGTGLGLALSRKLAQMLDGDVNFDSQKGVGSKFRLVLDNCAATMDFVDTNTMQQALSATRQPGKIATATRFKGRVLLVEDTPELRNLLVFMLRRVGIDAVVAENGQIALDKVTAETFDLILMDIQMPIVDGITAFKEIRGRNIVTPIIALTANAMKDDQERYKVIGFNGFLPKPVNRDEMNRLLAEFLATDAIPTPQTLSPLAPDTANKDPEFIKLINTFVARIPEFRTEFAAGLANESWTEVLKIAHKIRGSGAATAYPKLTELCSSVIFQFKNDNLAEVRRLVIEIYTLLERIIAGRSQVP